MRTIRSLDYLTRRSVDALKDAIADYDDAADLLCNVYDDVKTLYDKQYDSLDPDVRAMLIMILKRLRWACETSDHVRNILDRKVLYFTATRDDTQSHT